jgi:pimeloyl-ACP methyl ester carboxylesterase
VKGLVLSRPAWLDKAHPKNENPFLQIARLIRRHGVERGAELLKKSRLYQTCLRRSPDAAASLLRQFSQPRAEETVVKLERIPRFAPPHTRKDWKTISVPVLVLANRQDPIHPFQYGKTLARIIPGAEFKELTPKSVSPEQHAADVQKYLAEFLQGHFKPGPQVRAGAGRGARR